MESPKAAVTWTSKQPEAVQMNSMAAMTRASPQRVEEPTGGFCVRGEGAGRSLLLFVQCLACSTTTITTTTTSTTTATTTQPTPPTELQQEKQEI
ncbi:hypothetical protein QCA50_014142 [Cerrena zonata]|uniref:Uncharacterized protein n=1 Tax=Cerrena zonata TaxID=2478898 RepID=A0AAW0FUM5_9APHY